MDLIRGNLGVWMWLASDWLRKRLMPALSFAAYAGYWIAKPWSKARSLQLLMAAHRYGLGRRLTSRILTELPNIRQNMDQLLAWSASQDTFKDIARRSIVLKWPRRGTNGIEKGVLLITFTTSFSYFYFCIDVDLLQRWFTVVLEPSWAGYCIGDILFWTGDDKPPVIVQATEATDYEFIGDLNTNLTPVDFGASNWVDHQVFRKLAGVKKIYDAVYVANYKQIKRHHVLFRAINALHDPTYRLALVCTPWGGTKRTVYDLMDYFGVRNNVVVFEGLPAGRVNEVLNASKVCVLLSLKEGSNRSLFEAFFADVPGIVLMDNIGVNKRYFNRSTGRIIQEEELAGTLQFFREQWQTFSPRAWALENIAAPVTTRLLEEVLQQLAMKRGEPWTGGLHIKVNRPEVEFLDHADDSSLPMLKLLTMFDKQAGCAVAEIERQLLCAAA
jgi:glycosyltransferase involved in cell wall biosynthesis